MFKANRIGIAGILIGLLGIGVAIFQDDLRATLEPESPKLMERVVTKGISLFSENETPEAKHDRVDFLFMGLGLVALALGVFSFIQKESRQVASAAAGLGIIAIGWQYVLIGLIVAVVIFLLSQFSLG